MRTTRGISALTNVTRYFLLTILAIAVTFPFMWIISSSLKGNIEVIAYPPTLVPKAVTVSAYLTIFRDYAFAKYFMNSFIIATGATALSLIVGSFAAYSFSRLRFPGDQLFLLSLIGALMVPSIVLIIPIYVILNAAGLIDTHIGIILANCSYCIPLVAWMMRGFFSTIPSDLEDAGIIDGCSYLGVLFKIIMPLSAPGLAASAIFIFLIVWNEFLFALVFTMESAKTLPVITSEFIGVFEISWNQLAAAAVTTSIPILVFILIFQRRLISGLTQGAIKG
jgi:multiple sugar transport system permease protein